MTARGRAGFLVLLFLSFIGCFKAWCADKKSIQQKTNAAYYNLKSKGLAEFACNVTADWDTAFKAMKPDAVGRESVLPIARAIKFRVIVGPSGAASVSHDFGVPPPSEEVAQRLRQISHGMEQMLGGFFETWSQLMINAPLSGSDEEYQMEETLDGYRFTADHEKTHAVIVINRDFVIDAVEAKTPEFQGVIHPHFSREKDGLILASYEGDYTVGGSSQRLSVKVEYQNVDGLALPRTITLSMTLPQGQLNWPMTLEGCQAKKK